MIVPLKDYAIQEYLQLRCKKCNTKTSDEFQIKDKPKETLDDTLIGSPCLKCNYTVYIIDRIIQINLKESYCNKCKRLDTFTLKKVYDKKAIIQCESCLYNHTIKLQTLYTWDENN